MKLRRKRRRNGSSITRHSCEGRATPVPIAHPHYRCSAAKYCHRDVHAPNAFFWKDGLMLQGITATIFISDMDRAVDFYNKTLGLPLAGRWGDEYAAIDLGKGIAIGLHPAKGHTARSPGPVAPFRSASRWINRSMMSSRTSRRGG